MRVIAKKILREFWIKHADSEEQLSSWFFLPSGVRRPHEVPLVILSHGIGSQKDMGLARFGEYFQQNGIAALVFDFRSFGGSKNDWKVRNNINPWSHVNDILNVVSFAKSGKVSKFVDPNRIGLWGTSFSGGHVLVAGDKLGDAVNCIISQVPHMDGRLASKRAIVKRGFKGTLQLFLLVAVDFLRTMGGLTPLYVKIAGKGEEISYMSLDDIEFDKYFSKHPKVSHLALKHSCHLNAGVFGWMAKQSTSKDFGCTFTL